MRMSGRDRIVLFTPLAILLTGWLVLPALLGLLATFTNYSPFTATVRFAGLANYATILSDPQFGAAARNIAVFTVVAVPLELVIGFGIAYLLRRPLRGRSLWRMLLLLPWLVSPIASGVMWHFLFGSATGVLDFVLGWLGQRICSRPPATSDSRCRRPSRSRSGAWRRSSHFYCCRACRRFPANDGTGRPSREPRSRDGW